MILSWVANLNKGEVVMARTKKHMSQQDKEDWENLYEYVRHNVLGYDENQSLSRPMVYRLKGLLNNKFMANNNIEDINLDELEEEVVVDMQEAWEDIYKSFKDIETQLNGDGEAITATIDRLRDENKGNPDFEKAK